MTIRTTKLGGTDWGGEKLTSTDLNDTFGELGIFESQDQTGGSESAQTSETKIAETTVAANKVANGILILASGYIAPQGATSQQSNVTIRVGTSATIGSNTLVKTITRIHQNSSFDKESWSFAYYYTGATWSSANNVQIGGYGSVLSGTVSTVVCEHLLVIAF